MPKQRRWRRRLAALCVLGAVVGVYVAFGPPQLLAKSESPEFCASCHVMEAEYEAWFHEGAHRRIKCVDCHLPGRNVAEHYLWKGIDGMKDVVVFNSGLVPETIKLSEHGQKVVQDNCVRCHSTTVGMIDRQRQCWSCHRRMSHVRSGAILIQ